MKKKCKNCGLEKDVSEFYANPNCKDGYSTICKKCQNEISAKYVRDNKEKVSQYKRERYQRRKREFEELKRLVEEHGLNLGNN